MVEECILKIEVQKQILRRLRERLSSSDLLDTVLYCMNDVDALFCASIFFEGQLRSSSYIRNLPKKRLLYVSCDQGFDTLFDFAVSDPDSDPDIDETALMIVGERARKNIFRTILEREGEHIHKLEYLTYGAAKRNDSEFANLILSNCGPSVFKSFTTTRAALNHNMNMLEWLHDNRILNPTRKLIINCARRGAVDLLEFFDLASWMISSDEVVSVAVNFDKWEVSLQWFFERDARTLEWLFRRGLSVSSFGFDFVNVCCRKRNMLPILKWVVGWGARINGRHANTAASYGNLDVLKYLLSFGIMPTKRYILRAARRGHLRTVKHVCSMLNDEDLNDTIAEARRHGQHVLVESIENVRRRFGPGR